MAKFQVLPLSKLLHRVKDGIALQDEIPYKQVTVRLWNKGITLRGEQKGKTIKTKRQFLIRKGQLLLSRIDVRNGAIGIVPPELDGAIITNDFWAYEIDENLIEPSFLAFYLMTPLFTEESNRTSSGTTNRIRASEDLFLQITVPVPSLVEQHHIVAKIEILVARAREALSLREKAEGEVVAYIKSFRNEIFFSLSKEFKPVRLDSVAESRLGKMLSEKSKTGVGSVPYMRNANIQWDRIDISDVKQMDFSDEEQKEFLLKQGDILICEGGDIGKSAIWNNEIEYCCYQKALHRLRVDTKKVIPRFMLYHIFWAAEQGQFLGLKTQTTIAHLTGIKLKAFPVYIPPLSEQLSIVTQLDSMKVKVDELRHLQAETKAELAALIPSILDKAFKGEL